MSMDRFGDKVCCNPNVKLKKQESYPVIDIDKITPGYKAVRSVASIEYTGQGGAKFQDHDVLFARITPCLENGKMAIADTEGQNGIGSTELFVFRGIDGVSDTDYVYYLLCMKHIRQLAANSMTGASGRQRADLDFIKRIQWDFPDIEMQKKIASVLSAYDNLIEVNNKRIDFLEQIAENLYKEWFVRFRFPGHETAEFENGIPEGWVYRRADEVIDFNPTLKTGNQTEFTIIPMEALSTNSMVLDSGCFVRQNSISGRRSQNGDTLLAKITPCLENGKTGFVMGMPENEVLGGSTEFVVMRSKALTTHYVYCIARSYYFRQTAILSMNGADGRQRVDEDKLKSTKILQPEKAVLDHFETIVTPIFDGVYQMVQENKNLIQQRDLLLPRLMSGKLEVQYALND